MTLQFQQLVVIETYTNGFFKRQEKLKYTGSTESYDYYLLFCMIMKGVYGTVRCERVSKLTGVSIISSASC